MRGAVLLLLTLAGCSALAKPEEPRQATFVSLNPCTDAILAEVADPAQVLALSHYSHARTSSSMDLAKARRFRAVGDGVEEVLALRPDWVIAGTFLPPTAARAYQKLGFQLELMPIATSVDDSKAQVRRIAALAGHPERGEALVAQIDDALAAAAPPPGAAPITAVVWQSGGIVPGEGTLIADLMRRTGLANHSAARGLGQADQLPLEAMLADPPRLILTAGDAHSEEDRLLSHPALAKLTGTRRARFDPSMLWCGGPTIPRAVARLAQVRRSLSVPRPPPTPSSEEEGALAQRNPLPLLFRGGGWGVVAPNAKAAR